MWRNALDKTSNLLGCEGSEDERFNALGLAILWVGCLYVMWPLGVTTSVFPPTDGTIFNDFMQIVTVEVPALLLVHLFIVSIIPERVREGFSRLPLVAQEMIRWAVPSLYTILGAAIFFDMALAVLLAVTAPILGLVFGVAKRVVTGRRLGPGYLVRLAGVTMASIIAMDVIALGILISFLSLNDIVALLKVMMVLVLMCVVAALGWACIRGILRLLQFKAGSE